jgi:geranial dehydrogenase
MWVDRKHLFIGGEWVTPASSSRIDVINATSEESAGSVPEASSQDVDRAVTAARHALDSGWRTSAPSERAAALSRFADALEKRAPEIAHAVSVQNGTPLSLSEQFAMRTKPLRSRTIRITVLGARSGPRIESERPKLPGAWQPAPSA